MLFYKEKIFKNFIKIYTYKNLKDTIINKTINTTHNPSVYL